MSCFLINKNRIATKEYIEKADHFFQGMRLLRDDVPAYRTSIGLLAIHSAISLSDAIKSGTNGKRGKYQDHAQAAGELERLCVSTKVSDRKGITHLKWLIGQKSFVAYSQYRLDDTSVRQAVDKAERFNAWAYNSFKEVLRDL